jgi:hypothetical protein
MTITAENKKKLTPPFSSTMKLILMALDTDANKELQTMPEEH